MMNGDATIAKFHGSLRMHEDYALLRPFFSLPLSPAYNLKKEVWKRFGYLVAAFANLIENARQFLGRNKEVKIEDD